MVIPTFGIAHLAASSYLKSVAIVLIWIAVEQGVAKSVSKNHQHRLYTDLMDGYVKSVRPSYNHTRVLNVTFGFSLTQIIDVDERNQILTSNAWLNQMWMDNKLKWNPDQYGGLTMIHIPHDQIWKPDIVLYNNADSQYNTAIMSTDVFVNSKGNVTWLSAAIFKSSCLMNVRYYPFDEQVCDLKFASWAYDGSLIDLHLVSEAGDDSNYMASTEFELLNIRAKKHVVVYSCCDEPYPDVTITIGIRRKPLFYVFNLILPCIMITGIALLGFYMPSESGEKVTLGITTLLSMTVFMMLVAENMPPTSDALPLIGMYYGVTICLVSFATAMTVLTLNIHHKGIRGKRVPRSVRLFIFKYLAKVMCVDLVPPVINNCKVGVSTPKQSFSQTATLNHCKHDLYKDSVARCAELEPLTRNCKLSEVSHAWLNEIRSPVAAAMGQNVPTSAAQNERTSINITVGPNVESTFKKRNAGVTFDEHDTSSVHSAALSPTLHAASAYELTTANDATLSNSYSPQIERCWHENGSVAVSDRQYKSSSSFVPLNGCHSDKLLESQFSQLLTRIYSTIEKNEERIQSQDRKDSIKLEWQQVALVIDRFLLVLFIAITATSSILIIFQKDLHLRD